MTTSLIEQMQAVQDAASWTKQPTDEQRRALTDAYFTLKSLVKEKKVDPCYPIFVKAWTEAYPELGFDAVSGKKVKALIAKTRKYLIAGGKVDTVENCLGMFNYVLAYIKRDNHWVHGKDISTFETKYLSIVLEIKTGKNGKSVTTKKQSARDYINSFR